MIEYSIIVFLPKEESAGDGGNSPQLALFFGGSGVHLRYTVETAEFLRCTLDCNVAFKHLQSVPKCAV